MERERSQKPRQVTDPEPGTRNPEPIPAGIDDICQWYECVKCGEEMYFSLRATLAKVKLTIDAHRCNAAIRLRGFGSAFNSRVIHCLVIASLLAGMVGCSNKPNTNLQAKFNSVSARCARIAVYAQTGRDALPLIAAELKKDQAWIDRAGGILDRIKVGAGKVSVTLGDIADSAITADQKLLIGPVLTIVSDGLMELDQAGMFDLPGDSKLETYVHLAVIGLKTAIALLRGSGFMAAEVRSAEFGVRSPEVQAAVLPASSVQGFAANERLWSAAGFGEAGRRRIFTSESGPAESRGPVSYVSVEAIGIFARQLGYQPAQIGFRFAGHAMVAPAFAVIGEFEADSGGKRNQPGGRTLRGEVGIRGYARAGWFGQANIKFGQFRNDLFGKHASRFQPGGGYALIAPSGMPLVEGGVAAVIPLSDPNSVRGAKLWLLGSYRIPSRSYGLIGGVELYIVSAADGATGVRAGLARSSDVFAGVFKSF